MGEKAWTGSFIGIITERTFGLRGEYSNTYGVGVAPQMHLYLSKHEPFFHAEKWKSALMLPGHIFETYWVYVQDASYNRSATCYLYLDEHLGRMANEPGVSLERTNLTCVMNLLLFMTYDEASSTIVFLPFLLE